MKTGDRISVDNLKHLEVQIRSPATPIPKRWQKFIKNKQNTVNLSAFLASSWRQIAEERLNEGDELVIGGGFAGPNQAVKVRKGASVHIEELHSNHEEADTRLFLHDKHAARDHRRIVIQSPNTDVAVLCVSHFRDLSAEEVWFCTGVKDKMRYILVHKTAVGLNP